MKTNTPRRGKAGKPRKAPITRPRSNGKATPPPDRRDAKGATADSVKLTAKDRLDQVMSNKAICRQELARLYILVGKLSATAPGERPKKKYFDEKWLAERWSMSVKHVRKLRSAGVGPLVTYFGRSVRYRLRHVQQFEKANAFTSRTAKEQSSKV